MDNLRDCIKRTLDEYFGSSKSETFKNDVVDFVESMQLDIFKAIEQLGDCHEKQSS